MTARYPVLRYPGNVTSSEQAQSGKTDGPPMTTAAGSRFQSKQVEPHPFTPDCYDPGYRPHCRICHLDAAGHPYYRSPVPGPRRPA